VGIGWFVLADDFLHLDFYWDGWRFSLVIAAIVYGVNRTVWIGVTAEFDSAVARPRGRSRGRAALLERRPPRLRRCSSYVR